MMRNYLSDWNSPTDWLKQALWAYWMRDMEEVYAILTRVCHAEVEEKINHEQTQQAAY